MDSPDEFISIQSNISDEEIRIMCKQAEQLLIEKSSELPFQYTISASYGYVSREIGDNTSLNKLLHLSDEEMYKNKAKHN